MNQTLFLSLAPPQARDRAPQTANKDVSKAPEKGRGGKDCGAPRGYVPCKELKVTFVW